MEIVCSDVFGDFGFGFDDFGNLVPGLGIWLYNTAFCFILMLDGFLCLEWIFWETGGLVFGLNFWLFRVGITCLVFRGFGFGVGVLVICGLIVVFGVGIRQGFRWVGSFRGFRCASDFCDLLIWYLIFF